MKRYVQKRNERTYNKASWIKNSLEGTLNVSKGDLTFKVLFVFHNSFSFLSMHISNFDNFFRRN